MSNKKHNKKLSPEELTFARMNNDELRWVKGGYQDATAEEEGEFDEEEEGGEV